MSGPSKWSNIKHKKEKTDAQKAKVFTKIGKEISMAVKASGPDPASNSKLRDLIAKAKSNNVPNDNIERTIKKAASSDSETYEAITYEGYGPSGVAVIVETATDNRNRTGADLRHFFDKFGAGLGTTGCVSYLFHEAGVIILESEKSEDEVMEDALEAGAEDINSAEENTYEITTAPNDLSEVREALAEKGYTILSAENDKIPASTVTLTDDDAITKMRRLLDALDENEDVQEVFHNLENDLD
ncbi:MAG: YebC/PmpR family DNA-binding transcriptional regulator [Clostridia bacterium]|nr:YebC/PmpR family DNA-binding transcriptional regulator [Clostridia bacterium]